MITGKFTIGETLLSNAKKCSICGSGKELEPHHIINVNNYDELYNSPCNVIILCHTCHHNYHQEYNEVNFHTLLEYKNQFDKKRISKLQKNYNNLQKKNKLLKEKIKPFVLRKAKNNDGYEVDNGNYNIHFKNQSKAYECRNLLNTIIKEVKK